MFIHQFNNLTSNEQIVTTWENGDFLGQTVISNEITIQYFSLYDFFVELTCNTNSDTVLNVTSKNDEDKWEEYVSASIKELIRV